MLIRCAVPEDASAVVSLLPGASLGDVVLVAVDDGVVGVLSGTLEGVYSGPGAPSPPPHGYVLWVVVDEAHRRSGVGSALLDAFVAEAREAGVWWVFLFPEEGAGVEGRVEFLAAAEFDAVDDPDEQWPAMGRWAT